jgi:hypothetical protein
MQKAYKVIAHIIAGLVVLQAAFMVFAIAGLFKWIDDGATLDKGVIESWDEDPPTWDGAIGHFLHVMSGTFLIPLLAIVLLVIAFFAAVNGGVKWAAIILGSVVVQVIAGMTSGSAPAIGLIHGLNAFILFWAAIMAGRAAKQPADAQQPAMVG